MRITAPRVVVAGCWLLMCLFARALPPGDEAPQQPATSNQQQGVSPAIAGNRSVGPALQAGYRSAWPTIEPAVAGDRKESPCAGRDRHAGVLSPATAGLRC